MRVHGPLLINVVTMCNMPMLTMLAGEGEVTRGVDTRADQGSMTIDNWVTGHLVDWVTIVTVIMYRDGPACAATHCGGNCRKIKSEKNSDEMSVSIGNRSYLSLYDLSLSSFHITF